MKVNLEPLTNREFELVKLYRLLDEEVQALVFRIVLSAAKAALAVLA